MKKYYYSLYGLNRELAIIEEIFQLIMLKSHNYLRWHSVLVFLNLALGKC